MQFARNPWDIDTWFLAIDISLVSLTHPVINNWFTMFISALVLIFYKLYMWVKRKILNAASTIIDIALLIFFISFCHRMYVVLLLMSTSPIISEHDYVAYKRECGMRKDNEIFTSCSVDLSSIWPSIKRSTCFSLELTFAFEWNLFQHDQKPHLIETIKREYEFYIQTNISH